MAYNSRTEIDEKYLWDLTDMFADDAAFEAALERAQAYPEQIAAYQGSVSKSAAQLLAFLQLDTQVDLEMSKLVNWSQRKSDEDTRDSKYQAYSSQVMTLYTQLASAGAWFSSEILELSDAQMEQFYADVLATTDATNAAAQKELSSILALGEPETTPAEKPAAPAAKKARTTKKK